MAKRAKSKGVPTKEAAVEQPPQIPEESKVLSQIDRLAKLGTDYATKFTSDTAKGLYNYYGTLSMTELAAKLKNQASLTAIEKSIIVNIAKINTSGKDSMQAIEYFHERMFGKVPTKTELTGNNGGPLQVNAQAEIMLNKTIASMTDEELKALEESMDKLDDILGKANVKTE